MMTIRTHQSSACRPLEAVGQGCALVTTSVVDTATGRSYLRSLPFQGKKGFARLDTQAIGAVSAELKPGQSNPEARP